MSRRAIAAVAGVAAVSVAAVAVAVAVVSAAVVGLAACSSSGPSGAPADAVTRFYAAIDAGDCAAAQAQLSRGYRAELDREGVTCAVLVDEMRPFGLQAVVDTTVDGRNRDAHLVRVRLSGRQVAVIIRVQAEDGRWKIFSM